MSKEEIPGPVRRFVLTSIPSVPFLEALLLLHSTPGSAWTAREIARRLYIGEAGARNLLNALLDAGFVESVDSGSYRYAPEPALGEMVDQLEHWYSTRLVDMTALIHSKLDKRAQQLADAFRWSKEP